MSHNKTYSFSRRAGVSLGVPRPLLNFLKDETAVLIWNTPAANACDGSCCRRPGVKPPASTSRKLIIPRPPHCPLDVTTSYSPYLPPPLSQRAAVSCSNRNPKRRKTKAKKHDNTKALPPHCPLDVTTSYSPYLPPPLSQRAAVSCSNRNPKKRKTKAKNLTRHSSRFRCDGNLTPRF